MSSGQSKDGRQRVWDCVVYPDSAPENWRDILDDFHIMWCESPLHEFDIKDPKTGEVKKPHWHVIFSFDGPKSYDQVLSIASTVGCSFVERTHDICAMTRYLAHLDHPNKHLYDPDFIIGHGGYDVAFYLKPSCSSRYVMIREMIAYVKESGICEFQDLLDYASAERFNDWFPLLCDSCSYVVGTYIKSQRHRFERGE